MAEFFEKTWFLWWLFAAVVLAVRALFYAADKGTIATAVISSNISPADPKGFPVKGNSRPAAQN